MKVRLYLDLYQEEGQPTHWQHKREVSTLFGEYKSMEDALGVVRNLIETEGDQMRKPK
jgi:hypothetical protein